MNDEQTLIKRLKELSNRANNRFYTTYSDFLSLDEISLALIQDYNSSYAMFGGYESAERKIIAFGESIDNNTFPIVCIKIEPVQQKFADKLNHRDFLGALMNLGINRNTLGDIVIKDNIGYLFCLDTIGDYIVESLNRIKHTTVKCTVINEIPEFFNILPDEEEIIVSSLRVDVIISAIFKLSRNQATQLINQEKVFINSRIAYKESLILKDNDRISVRGYGKFILSDSKIRETKKGKNIVGVRIYR